MNAELITNWAEHDNSLKKILALATKTLRIFDEDLSKLKLERSENAEILRRFLGSDREHTLRIILKNTDPFRRNSPRLMKLLVTYPHNMSLFESPAHLESINGSLFIADQNHALIRFHKDNVRAKAIIDDTEECLPYVLRFEEIMKEGGEPVCVTQLGL
jgi:hypothetical protein